MSKDKDKDEVSNFINYSEKVFILSDNDANISHDIPFKNHYSGVIKIYISAKNDIFIRKHYEEGDSFYIHPNDDKKIHISHEFCYIKNENNQKKYYIPATSIKGVIRNTLEILSYGKLKGKTDDEYLNAKIYDSNSLHQSDSLDLSEAIFGTTELKGRVYFSHFKAIGEVKVCELQKEILMTPEAKKKKFGWKNYPILNTEIKSKKGNNEDVISEFMPLKSTSKFEGKLRFHNLRDFEIGALISALSFHNTQECYHNIGYAKSLGYGKVSIKFDYEHKNKVLQAFEEKMNIEIFNGKMLWHKSEYIKELLNKHAINDNEFKALSDKDSLDSERIKKEQEVIGKKQAILELTSDITVIPSKSSKEFKSVIEKYVVSNVKPLWYDYNHLKMLLEGKQDDIRDDDIFYSYDDLTKLSSFKIIEPLLLKREQNKITDLELTELYKLLCGSI
jgi:CRISPR/Cas system CSM-associated protein Csm3 (group 7 of RAMP superfamily)